MPELRFAGVPPECLFDADFRITLLGLRQGDEVLMRAANAGGAGTIWLSEATFIAPGPELDLGRSAPVRGNCSGVDAMGLIWSRSPYPKESVALPIEAEADPMVVALVAQVNGGAPVTHSVRRRYFDEKVAKRDVREHGLVAQAFEPVAPGAPWGSKPVTPTRVRSRTGYAGGGIDSIFRTRVSSACTGSVREPRSLAHGGGSGGEDAPPSAPTMTP